MNWQTYSYNFKSNSKQEHQGLFRGIIPQWSLLTQSEKVVGLGIVLIPLWWLWGWSYLLLFLAIGIFTYEFFKRSKIRLQQPSLTVLALIAYGLYNLISNYFYGLYNSSSLSTRDLIGGFNTIFAPAAVIWYIQSKNIRVRLQVVAWAFSIVVVLMLAYWFYIFFVLHQVTFEPSRSLFGILTGKPLQYKPGLGNSNYLIPYRAEDSSLPGLARYFFFFHGPESLALVVSFICLLSLDLKNRLWFILLFSGAFFILLTSGTRSAWLSLPTIIIIRWLLKTGASKGAWLICGLIALVSFVFLVITPVTEFVFNTVSNTAQATSEFRGDSTDVRAEIYRRTFERVLESSNQNFLFGHVVHGETVLPGYAPAMVGTHSFYLGSLLYIKGLVGIGIFATYWISLIAWLYQTRFGRPISCIIIFILFSITFCVMAFESTVMPIILIALTTYNCSQVQQKKRKILL
ncbi:MAG: O-antigen ligase family protein [Moorea sp. SIO2I5]|nr:O-antigen ligase family protein [Moorena sp. SIO2I5]